jgi:hypothetical protein
MTDDPFSAKRTVPRFSFVAEAEAIAYHDGTRLLAQISELSAKGCYLETPEGFPVGTELRLRIRYGGSKCDVAGRTIYKHEGWGMGVVFSDLNVEQRYILNGWLDELARKAQSLAPFH